MPATPLWTVDNVSGHRRQSLAEPFEFSELIERVRSEVRNVRFEKDKGTHEAKGLWRPIILFDVTEETFDCFFNSPYGYRGQFLIEAAVGRKANSEVMLTLAAVLVQGAALNTELTEQVQQALVSPHAKIWIDENQHNPKQPELIVQVRVAEWEAAAIAAHDRLVRHDPTLTSKEIDRIYGVRAPSGSTLKAMGAWVASDGSLRTVPSKLLRAEEIKAYGVS